MLLALVAMGGSAVYWWGVQSVLTENRIVSLAFTAILVLAPPALTSFLIPWSPGGMLLQKINARTWGYLVVVACSLFLIYYSFQIQWSWWAAQQVTADSGLVYQQVLIGIIGFIIIPALLWTPVTSEELVEQVRQAHLVKRYELQTQADIAILRATLLRAQEKALVGFANLTTEEREELAGVMRGLIAGIDRTLQEVGQSVKTISGAAVPFGALEDNDDIRDVLDYIGDSLIQTTLVNDREHERYDATPQLTEEQFYSEQRHIQDEGRRTTRLERNKRYDRAPVDERSRERGATRSRRAQRDDEWNER